MSEPKNTDDRETPLQFDKPIEVGSDDRLQRTGLASNVARMLVPIGEVSSIVVAINAPWGAGKSSFLNLVRQQLEMPIRKGTLQPLVVRFDPWLYSNTEQLIQAFFGEMAAALKMAKAGSGELLNKLASLLALFGKTVTLASVSFPKIAPAGILATFIAKAMKALGKLFSKTLTLADQKHALDHELRIFGKSQRIIVMIDDIDRLEPENARLVFKLVRLIADLPAISYLLAYDRAVVEAMLDDPAKVKGADYLEKIVQLTIDLPTPTDEVFQKFMEFSVNGVLKYSGAQFTDEERWRELVRHAILPCFSTIRQIYRFENGLHVLLPSLAGEVCAEDFIALEVVRTFHPTTYARLPDYRRELTGRKKLPEDWKETILAGLAEEDATRAHAILAFLFPVLTDSKKLETVGISEDRCFHRRRRICDSYMFARYFLFRVPEPQIPESLCRPFVEDITANHEKNIQVYRDIVEQGYGEELYVKLFDSIDAIPPDKSLPLLHVLIENAWKLEVDARLGYDNNTIEDVALMVYRFLNDPSYDDSQRLSYGDPQRAKYLITLLTHATPLCQLTRILDVVWPTYKEQRTQILTDEEHWKTVKDHALTLYNEAFEEDRFLDEPFMLSSWLKWRYLLGEADFHEMLKAKIQDGDWLIKFLYSIAMPWCAPRDGDGTPPPTIDANSRTLLEESDLLTVVKEKLGSMVRSSEGSHGEEAQQLLDALEGATNITP